MSEFIAKAKLLDLCVKQLHKEYEQINWAYRLGLLKPQISIVSAQSFYGQWDPLLRQIKLSTLLIENHPWPVVLEVLKHEIAHQLVTDRIGLEEGHGPHFIGFCEHLGIDKSLQRSKVNLDLKTLSIGRLPPDEKLSENEETSRLFQKVERLLSLAQSVNEHEALLAMEKVNELYEKYNIDRLQHKVPSESHAYIILNLDSKTVSAIYSVICSILSEHFFVEPILSQTFEPLSGQSSRTIELFGTTANLKMAEYVFYFLKNKVHELWLVEAKKSRLQSGLKRSYQLGLLHGFNSKLQLAKKQRRESSQKRSTEKSLLTLKDSQLSLFIARRYPRLTSKKANHSRINGQAYSKGQEEGMRLILNKGIEKNKGQSRLLIK